MQIVIEGNPIPKARARTFMRGAKSITYDPQESDKQLVKLTLLNALKKSVSLEGFKFDQERSFSVEMTFYLAIPKNFSQRQKNKVLWGMDDHLTKPDIDNLAKFYLDCANQILFHDDKQIVNLLLKKTYSNKPCTVINIMPREPLGLANHIQEILGVLGPEEIEQLVKDTQELAKEYEELKEEDHHFYFRNYQSLREQRLAKLASLISSFASKYSDRLRKVAKFAE